MTKTFYHTSSLIPLYLGVTGHRDIRDEDREPLKKFVADYIVSKQRQCPNTPVILLTPLAEGADQIAALAAMECNIGFIAVLPMPVEEYKRDFVEKESLKEFEHLLSKSQFKIELPLHEGITIENIQTDREKRNGQYYQSGLFIAQQCHTLIALWDGTNNGKKGGTANVVKLKESGIPGKIGPTSKRLHYLQTGPICHIVTPRKSNRVQSNPLPPKITYSKYYGTDEDKAAKDDEEMLRRIDSFNKDVKRLVPGLRRRNKIDSKSLFPDFPDFSKDPYLHQIAKKHSVAGALAGYFQKRRFLALKVLLSLVVIAYLFMYINSEFVHEPYLLLLYPITMGIGALWFFIADRKHYEYKHEDYRALSEALRIQFYLKAAGMPDNVSDHYLKKHRGELEWVLYALRSSQIFDIKHTSVIPIDWDGQPMQKFVFLKTCWIDGQLDYFIVAAGRHHKSTKKWETNAKHSFLSAIIAACLLSIVSLNAGLFPAMIQPYDPIIRSILSCGTSVLLVLAAALHGFSDKMVFAEQAKNYFQMAQLFQMASKKLSQAIEMNDESEAEEIIGELTREALLENGDWLLLHRSRFLEFPKG